MSLPKPGVFSWRCFGPTLQLIKGETNPGLPVGHGTPIMVSGTHTSFPYHEPISLGILMGIVWDPENPTDNGKKSQHLEYGIFMGSN